MSYAGVLFDLFGTLVAPFRMREHTDAIRECAAVLGIEFEECHRSMGETFPLRMRGEFASLADNLAWIASQAGRPVTRRALARVEAVCNRFTAECLQPVDGALALLETLTARGVRIGLVSNCARDIPRRWLHSAFAPYFGFCAFSCELHAMKPQAEIYHAALDALSLRPAETLYVGDGSDEELTGAARCGLQPVLISTDLTNTYDARRTDVEGWSGPVIQSLAELLGLIEGAVSASPHRPAGPQMGVRREHGDLL